MYLSTSDYVFMQNKMTGTVMQVAPDRVSEYESFGHSVIESTIVKPIVFEKKEDSLTDAADKLKKAVRKTRKKKD